MAAYALDTESNGKTFEVRDFFDIINQIGNIPVALTQWEMTGNSDDIIMMK